MIVTVVCAFTDRQRVLRVEVAPGATVGEALEASDLLQHRTGIARQDA